MKPATIAILVVLATVASVVVTKLWWPTVETVVSYEQAQIDEETWVRRAVLESERQTLRRISRENEDLARRIARNDEIIAGYTQILGRLSLKIDEISQNTASLGDSSINFAPQRFSDTFSDSLFVVSAEVSAENGVLLTELDLKQLRDIRLSVVTTLSEDQKQVRTYVTSPDFSDLSYQSHTNLRAPKRKWYHWFGYGILTGAVIWELAR